MLVNLQQFLIAIDNSVTPFSVLDPEPEEFLPKLKSAEAPHF